MIYGIAILGKQRTIIYHSNDRQTNAGSHTSLLPENFECSAEASLLLSMDFPENNRASDLLVFLVISFNFFSAKNTKHPMRQKRLGNWRKKKRK